MRAIGLPRSRALVAFDGLPLHEMERVERGHLAGAGSPLELVQVYEALLGLAYLEDERPSVSEHARVYVLSAHAVEEVLLPFGHLQGDVPDDLLDGGLVHLALPVAVGAALPVALPAGPDGLRDLAAVLVVASGDEQGGDVELDVPEAGVHEGHDLGVLELHPAVDHGERDLPDLAVELGLDGFRVLEAVLLPEGLLVGGNRRFDPRSDQEVLGFDRVDGLRGDLREAGHEVEDPFAHGACLGRFRCGSVGLGQSFAYEPSADVVGHAGADLSEHASEATVAESLVREGAGLVQDLGYPVLHALASDVESHLGYPEPGALAFEVVVHGGVLASLEDQLHGVLRHGEGDRVADESHGVAVDHHVHSGQVLDDAAGLPVLPDEPSADPLELVLAVSDELAEVHDL